MNVLVAMGSFKDVFSPIEITHIVSSSLEKHNVVSLPMCDGGEYTFDVLSFHRKCKKIEVDGIINPYGSTRNCKYIAIDNAAYIISSEILRLHINEERYKNPLQLTDYGLGQLVADAIKRGFTSINICLGGTSTVDFGMGFAQALGCSMIDNNGNVISEPLTPLLIEKVAQIGKIKLKSIFLNVINDGITTAHDLEKINPQKIGTMFIGDKELILQKLDSILYKVCNLTSVDVNTPFAGNAGGVCFGIECITHGNYVKGTEYFMDIFNLKAMMQEADIIFTGEGKLDNIHVEKLPVAICKIAKQMNKKCVYICGQRDPDLKTHILRQYGIEDIVCCMDHYSEFEPTFCENIDTYKRLTPIVLRKELATRYG